MITFRLENSRFSIILYFLVSLPLIFLLLSINVCNLYTGLFSVTFLGLLLLVLSSSYVMALFSIHLKQVLIPGKLLILRLSGLCCIVRKLSWVYAESCCFRLSFNASAIDILFKGGSRTAATSKMEYFVIIVNGWKLLTIITKHSILDILDPPLLFTSLTKFFSFIYYLCYCLLRYFSEHRLLQGLFDLWP